MKKKKKKKKRRKGKSAPSKKTTSLIRGAHVITIDDDNRIAYLDIRIDGKYGSIKRLAERRGIPHNTAKDWIRKAKERGLYPPDAHKREE